MASYVWCMYAIRSRLKSTLGSTHSCEKLIFTTQVVGVAKVCLKGCNLQLCMGVNSDVIKFVVTDELCHLFCRLEELFCLTIAIAFGVFV